MSPNPNNTCSVPFLGHEKSDADEDPILEPQSPNSPLMVDEVGIMGSQSSNNINIGLANSNSRRESKTSGIISQDLIHQFILEPTLNEKKQLKLFQPDDDGDESSDSMLQNQTIPTKLWPQVIEFSVIFVRVYSNHKLHL